MGWGGREGSASIHTHARMRFTASVRVFFSLLASTRAKASSGVILGASGSGSGAMLSSDAMAAWRHDARPGLEGNEPGMGGDEPGMGDSNWTSP